MDLRLLDIIFGLLHDRGYTKTDDEGRKSTGQAFQYYFIKNNWKLTVSVVHDGSIQFEMLKDYNSQIVTINDISRLLDRCVDLYPDEVAHPDFDLAGWIDDFIKGAT